MALMNINIEIINKILANEICQYIKWEYIMTHWGLSQVFALSLGQKYIPLNGRKAICSFLLCYQLTSEGECNFVIVLYSLWSYLHYFKD